MIVALYTSRIVLHALGAVDYGLYHVVGGIVVLFSFLNSSLRSGTTRFLSYGLGEANPVKVREVFCVSLSLHTLLSVVICIISEIAGLWLMHNYMQIPTERMSAAIWVLHFSIIASMIKIIQVPFEAIILSQEKMNIYAYIGIIDVTLKLLVAILIQITNHDKLVAYAFLLLTVHALMPILLIGYCRRKYHKYVTIGTASKSIFHEMSRFIGWDVMRSGAVVLQNQGLNILLNIFFGAVVNAAKGLASQINSAIQSFVMNLQEAVNPQIIKLYASGESNIMIKLVINNSKMSAMLYALLAIPVFIEIEFLLKIWLVEYPAHTPSFVRITMVLTLVWTMTQPVVMAVRAVGKMRNVNLTSSIALLLVIPLCYGMVKAGGSPEAAIAIVVVPWFIELFFYLYWLNKYIGFPIWGFYRKVYAVVIPLCLFASFLPCIVHFQLESGWFRLIIVTIVSLTCSSLLFLFLGMTNNQRHYITNLLLKSIGAKAF